MRVVLLGPANSIHIHRWVDAFTTRGTEITLVSQHEPAGWKPPATVPLYKLPFDGATGYFANVSALRGILRRLKPDLLNAHYASGYGTTAALAGYSPTLLSVWGSDVFAFPYQSRWRRALLRFNLRRATRIASTSRVMAEQVCKLEPALAPPFVTPFGVDCTQFRPDRREESDAIIVGSVKTLAPEYGIDILIRAFALMQRDRQLKDANVASRLRLLLVGGGQDRGRLQALADQACMPGTVTFAGPVQHDAVPMWLNRLDIYVAASRSESFGVAVAEASACGLPVVVSDVGGLAELVQDGKTGLVVPRESVEALAASIKRLALDDDLRRRLGQAGRDFVVSNYEWQHCVNIMESAYREMASR